MNDNVIKPAVIRVKQISNGAEGLHSSCGRKNSAQAVCSWTLRPVRGL